MQQATSTAHGSRTVLVLGATGGIGRATAEALARHGWQIRALARRGAPAGDISGWEWVRGDALQAADVLRAAQGAAVLVHAVNPASYDQWAAQVLPMLESTLQAARATGARILLPGTIYNYGPDAFPCLREDSPQHPLIEQGRLRVQLEQRLEQAATEGVPSLIVRFGDFFGPQPGHSWFSQGLVRPGRSLRVVRSPGRPGAAHAWAYLPDCGEVFAQLLDREAELPPFARFHFRGHLDPDGQSFPAAIGPAAGRPGLPVRRFPWWLIRVGAIFSGALRGLYAVRPLWETSIELDNAQLVAFLGQEPHTPLPEALMTTLRGLGCQPASRT